MSLRCVAVVAGLALGLMSGAAYADKIVTFKASGLFADGATLGGTYVVDTTTGNPVSVDLTFGPPVSSDVTILDGNAIYNGMYTQETLNNTVGPNFYPGLTLVFNAPSLVDFTGGALNQSTTLFLDSSNSSDSTRLVFGSLTAVPLPSSAPMLGAALVALGAAGFVAKRKKATAA